MARRVGFAGARLAAAFVATFADFFGVFFLAAAFLVVLPAIVFTPLTRAVRRSPAWPPTGARRSMTAPRARRCRPPSPTPPGHPPLRGGR